MRISRAAARRVNWVYIGVAAMMLFSYKCARNFSAASLEADALRACRADGQTAAKTSVSASEMSQGDHAQDMSDSLPVDVNKPELGPINVTTCP